MSPKRWPWRADPAEVAEAEHEESEDRFDEYVLSPEWQAFILDEEQS